MENVPQWVFALLGAMRIGAVTVPLATALPENSIQLIAEHAGCKVIVADETNWEKASHVAGAVRCAVIKATGCPMDKTSTARDHAIKGSDTALVIYTSWTTGNPTGVALTCDNVNR